MKKQILFLTLCIGLLLSGCQKTPAEAPWENGAQDAPLSYAEYFAETRTYDTADYAYTPAWLQTGDYEIDCEDGELALYRTADGERLAVYAEQPFLSWRTGSSGVYVFREQDILRCAYDGSQTETLYAPQGGTIIDFTAAGDVLFFAEKADGCIRLCRLYTPEERLDVLYDAVSPDAEGVLLFPVSNHEICWSMENPAFLKLAEEQKQTYIETRNLDPDDQSTYWGMLELDFNVNSGIRYYYNDLTQELRSQEFRIIYGEESGADWWKTAAQEETTEASGLDQYDEIKTWSWAPYETLYRTDGTRMGLVREADGTRHIGEIPDTKVWIRLKDGTLLSDEPFDACIDYMGTPEGEVYCIRNGTGYRYTVSAGDGSFRLSEVDEPEILEEDHFGYRLRVTRWDSREPCYGIVTADGTEVIAPVYERVEIPFPDRFLLYEGGASQGPVMGRCRLTDKTGSTLCARFHWIDYSVFDNGYIGIAVCYGERAAYPCYDEDGQPMPEGYWLVDRDGNLCSERFAKLSFGDGDETHTASEEDVLRALREDGTEELLPVAELLLPVGESAPEETQTLHERLFYASVCTCLMEDSARWHLLKLGMETDAPGDVFSGAMDAFGRTLSAYPGDTFMDDVFWLIDTEYQGLELQFWKYNSIGHPGRLSCTAAFYWEPGMTDADLLGEDLLLYTLDWASCTKDVSEEERTRIQEQYEHLLPDFPSGTGWRVSLAPDGTLALTALDPEHGASIYYAHDVMREPMIFRVDAYAGLDEELLQQYLEVIASTATSSDAPASASL